MLTTVLGVLQATTMNIHHTKHHQTYALETN